MEAIRLWRLLAMVLAALLVVAAVGGTEFHEEEDAEEELDDRRGAQEWSGSSRMLLASKLEPPSGPPKCYRSNCANNDTNLAVCKQQGRDQKSRSIQCCKYNPETGFSGPPIPYYQSSGCVDLSSEANYCGSCTTVCPAGHICCGGACIDTCCQGACPAGLTCCANKCVDVTSDAAHCSGCGLACPAGQPSCCAGGCVNFLVDELNCGGCDSFCEDRCCNGHCKYTFTDPDSCGNCGLACPPDLRVCCAGECFNSSPGFNCFG